MTITVLSEKDFRRIDDTVQGDIINILDFCLVTTLGYNKVYSDTPTKTAIYQKTGNHVFKIRCDNNDFDGNPISGSRMFCYAGGESQSGGLLTNQYPSSPFVSAVRSDWIFISNGDFFYFIQQQNMATSAGSMLSYNSDYTEKNSTAMAFGKFASLRSSDIYNYICIGTTTDKGFSLGIQSSSISSANVYYSLARDDDYTTIAKTPITFFNANLSKSMLAGYGSDRVLVLQDNYLVTTKIIGKVPGLFGCQNVLFRYSGETQGDFIINNRDIVTIGSDNYIAIVDRDNNNGVFIKITGSW